MQIKAGKSQNLYKLIQNVKNSSDADIEVFFEKTSDVYQNAANLKILKKVAEESGKKLNFTVEDKNHEDYIKAVNEDRLEYVTPEIDIDYNNNSAVSTGSKLAFLAMLDPRKFFKKSDGDAAVLTEPSKSKKFIKPAVIAAVALLFVFGSAYAALAYIPAANVKIKMKSEVLIKLLDIKATEGASVSAEAKTIPAIAITATENESKTIPTTGVKQTGDKAKGTIVVFNKTDDDVELKKGTVVELITTDNKNLKYVTTEEVEIPEQSTPEATVDNPTPSSAPGTKSVKIEAFEFGEKYNIDDGEKFEIDDYDDDDLVGESDGDIKGGNEKQIKVVAQTDMDSLKREVEEMTKKKVMESVKKKLISAQELSESSVQFETKLATYNKKLDEEAEDLTLTIEMTGNGLAYSKDDLEQVVTEAAKTVVPDTFNLDSDNIDFETVPTIDPIDKKVLNVQVKLKSYIFPKVDIEEIKRELAGNSIDDAEDYLSKLNNIEEYAIELSPRLPGVLYRMPSRTDNINVKLEK